MISTSNTTHASTVLATHDLRQLMEVNGGPCISIYMPSTVRFNEAPEMARRFRELVDAAERQMSEHGQRRPARDSLLTELRRVQDDMAFWRTQPLQGLAAFRAPDEMRLYRLMRPPIQVAIVANSYHIKPLVRLAQDATRFQVLCVGREDAALFEGNRDHLEQVDIVGLPARGEAPARTLPREKSADEFVGSNRAKEYTALDFKDVDRLVLEHHSRPSGLPLILAALPQHQSLFRSICKNSHLMQVGIERDPFKAMDTDTLRALAWETVQPHLQEQARMLYERYTNAQAHDQGSDKLERIAEAATQGRIETLWVESDRQIGGHIDRGTGRIQWHDIRDPATDDVLDDLAELTLRQGGQVVVLPAAKMPTGSGAFAIERYKLPGSAG